MNINLCKHCGKKFVVKRAICPNCGNEDIEQITVSKGKVVESVDLIASPDPFPEKYSIILVESTEGVRLFCRSQESIPSGTEVEISVDALGPVCKQSSNQ